MKWLSDNARQKIMRHLGPGMLCGITLKQWLKLLAESPFSVDVAFLPRVLSITFQSIHNSYWLRAERRRYGPLIEKATIRPPLFILGHWRSGTTHLHELITRDERFSFPNNYQVCFPQVFLSTEAKYAATANAFIPRHRPMDKMKWDIDSPQEDEFAVCASILKSPCMAWVFPRRREQYEKYLTLREVEPDELVEWRAAFEQFLKKLQLRAPRTLVLKSPPHTARIRLLLEMFPSAKFVHIHRHPFAVFQSTRHLFQKVIPLHCLQHAPPDYLDDWIIHQYRQMHDAFFEDRLKIPAGNYCEVAFEQLETDPVAQVRRIYEMLNLPAFDSFEPVLRNYANSLAGYQKNTFPDLPVELKERLKRDWKRCFEEWGYTE